MNRDGGIVALVFAGLVGLLYVAFPYLHGQQGPTIGQAHALCVSSAGALAQFLDRSSASACRALGWWWALRDAAGLQALGLAGVGLWLVLPVRQPEQQHR